MCAIFLICDQLCKNQLAMYIQNLISFYWPNLYLHSTGSYPYTMYHVAKLKMSTLLEDECFHDPIIHDWDFGTCGTHQLDAISLPLLPWLEWCRLGLLVWLLVSSDITVPLNINLGIWSLLPPTSSPLLPLTLPPTHPLTLLAPNLRIQYKNHLEMAKIQQGLAIANG